LKITQSRQSQIAAVIITVLLLVIGLTISCSKQSQKHIEIGYIGSISGKFAALGSTARDGALLAVEEINAEGGINGRPIKLVIGDDEGDFAKAEELAKQYAENKLKFIIGPFTTASATRVVPVINSAEILTIGPVVAGENLANKDDYFLKLYPSTKTFGIKLAELATGKGLRNLVTINDKRNLQYCETLLDGFIPALKTTGGMVLENIWYSSFVDVPYSLLAGGALQNPADGVLICASALDTALFSQNLKKINQDIPLFSSSWAISHELIDNGGRAVEGLLFFIPFTYGDTTPEADSFEQRYSDRFDVKSTYAAMFNYEAVYMLADALRNDPSASVLEIKRAIIAKKLHNGMQHDYSLNADGDAQRELILHTIKNKAFSEVL
jgi:branched-chain amino acid transport system substrate-binding protein